MQFALNNYLIVQFSDAHNKVFNIAGVEIIRPDRWTNKEEDGTESGKYGYNVNMKDVHPQIATVIVPNEKFPYRKGDRVFLHYMAKETEEPMEIDGKTYSAVGANFVFFVIQGDKIVLADNTYLGEQIVVEAPRTPSGIYTTPFATKKEALKIRITHLPEQIVRDVYGEKYYSKTEIQVGDIVCTCDDYQYTLNYQDKEYVKLSHDEIVGKFVEEDATA